MLTEKKLKAIQLKWKEKGWHITFEDGRLKMQSKFNDYITTHFIAQKFNYGVRISDALGAPFYYKPETIIEFAKLAQEVYK